MGHKMELVCPAGTLESLYAAVDSGADTVYVGFADETNARNFPGLNFSRSDLKIGVAYAHDKGVDVLLALNTYPKAGREYIWKKAVDDAVFIGVDAIIMADVGLLAYASEKHNKARLHLSVQASASHQSAIEFYQREFGVKRVVLPRVLTVPEIKKLNTKITVETEVFAFGGMCPMAEGRCSLSSYITGESPNRNGVCSPASSVEYEDDGSILRSKLAGFTINEFYPFEKAGYPTLCKGRFVAEGEATYLFEEPTSLSTFDILQDLHNAGVTALKIEGRQRGKAYVREIVTQFRQAIDKMPTGVKIESSTVRHLCEGGVNTTGAYGKKWQ